MSGKRGITATAFSVILLLLGISYSADNSVIYGPAQGYYGKWYGPQVGKELYTITLDTLTYDTEADPFEWYLSGTLSEAHAVQHYLRLHGPASGWSTSNLWAGWALAQDYGDPVTDLACTTSYEGMALDEIESAGYDSAQMMVRVLNGILKRSAWSTIPPYVPPENPAAPSLSDSSLGIYCVNPSYTTLTFAGMTSCTGDCSTMQDYIHYQKRHRCTGTEEWTESSWGALAVDESWELIGVSVNVATQSCTLQKVICPEYDAQLRLKTHNTTAELEEISEWYDLGSVALP